MESDASELLEEDADAMSTATSGRGYSNASHAEVDATETTFVLLKKSLAKTAIKPIETDANFWLINLCHVYAPNQNMQIYTNDGCRLWCPIKIKDQTGDNTLFRREKAAVNLVAFEGKQDFGAARIYETLHLPQQNFKEHPSQEHGLPETYN